MYSVQDRKENIVGKRENAAYLFYGVVKSLDCVVKG